MAAHFVRVSGASLRSAALPLSPKTEDHEDHEGHENNLNEFFVTFASMASPVMHRSP
jgi:hypothetical protein